MSTYQQINETWERMWKEDSDTFHHISLHLTSGTQASMWRNQIERHLAILSASLKVYMRTFWGRDPSVWEFFLNSGILVSPIVYIFACSSLILSKMIAGIWNIMMDKRTQIWAEFPMCTPLLWGTPGSKRIPLELRDSLVLSVQSSPTISDQLDQGFSTRAILTLGTRSFWLPYGSNTASSHHLPIPLFG